jgi:hypothetical protein
MSREFILATTTFILGVGISSGLYHVHDHWIYKVLLVLYAITAGTVLAIAWQG